MKYSILLAVLLPGLFLGGCARDAYYADHEFGAASRDAFDQQIVNKDYKYAGMPVEGMDGIFAENIMGKHLDTFKEKSTKEDFDITETGLSDE